MLTEEIRDLQKTSRRQPLIEYRQLVSDYAREAELDPMNVIRLLEAADRNVDHLEADAKAFDERNATDQRIQNAIGLRSEIARLEAELQSERETFEAIQRDYRRKVGLMSSQLHRHEAEVADVKQLQKKLRATAATEIDDRDKELFAKEKDTRNRLSNTSAQLQRAETSLVSWKRDAESRKESLARAKHSSPPPKQLPEMERKYDEATGAVRNVEGRIKQFRQQLTDLQAELIDLTRQREVLDVERMDPINFKLC